MSVYLSLKNVDKKICLKTDGAYYKYGMWYSGKSDIGPSSPWKAGITKVCVFLE